MIKIAVYHIFRNMIKKSKYDEKNNLWVGGGWGNARYYRCVLRRNKIRGGSPFGIKITIDYRPKK